MYCFTVYRGLPASVRKGPFIKWYGHLGELRSLIPKECNMLLTSTATKRTKQQILETLLLSADDITIVEQSPTRPNLFHAKQYLDKNEALEKQFGSLIDKLKRKGTETRRTLIYSQTWKQCSVLFRMFEVYLGKKMYNGDIKPQNRMVDMYQHGTPEAVMSLPAAIGRNSLVNQPLRYQI